MRLSLLALAATASLVLAYPGTPGRTTSDSSDIPTPNVVDPCAAACEPVFCIQSIPDGCLCQNEAKKRCAECRGEVPVLDDCDALLGGIVDSPAPDTTTSVSSDIPTPSVVDSCAAACEPVFCIQSIPDSCICQNEARKRCAECRGEVPVLDDCDALFKGIVDGLGGPGSVAAGPENLPTAGENETTVSVQY